MLMTVPGNITSWLIWNIAPAGRNDKVVKTVGTSDTLLLDVDLPSMGYKYFHFMCKNPSTSDTLYITVKTVSYDGSLEQVYDSAEVSPGDICEIYYIHPLRYRVYARFGNSSNTVTALYRVWRV